MNYLHNIKKINYIASKTLISKLTFFLPLFYKGNKFLKAVLTPLLIITLVNTQFGASSIKTVLGYIWGADSKNDIGFFASALVFELRHTPIILTFICYTWILSNKEFV